MKRKDAIMQMDRIHQLVMMKATGNPNELASKLEVSERTIYRLLSDLADVHSVTIRYSYLHKGYIIFTDKK